MSLFVALLVVLSTSFVIPAEVRRSVVRDYDKIWRRGDVVYTLSGAFSPSEQILIKGVMKEIEDDVKFHGQYCVQFHNKAGQFVFDPDYIFFAKGSSCSFPNVGMPHNRGTIQLARECMDRRTLLYYMMRILGVFDEHNRIDRDTYVTVNLTNVADAFKPRFNKIPANEGDTESLPYDYQSITHYGPYAHAKDPRYPTITSKQDGIAFGDKGGLSYLDVERVQILYRCHIDTSHVLQRPIRPVDCDFERALCNLADDWQDDFTWDRKDGPVSNSGPQADHSNGHGYFLYANGTSPSGGKARLISAREIPPGQYCVELYYYLLGSGASLEVISEEYRHNKTMSLNTATANNGISWSHLKFGTVSQVFWRIIFEATMADDSGGVAIDDVSVIQGYCV